MATTTRPDQDRDQDLRQSEGDFAQWERELHKPSTSDLPTADQSGIDAEEQSIRRAKRLLEEEQPLLGRDVEDARDLESNPEAPQASQQSVADQEAKPTTTDTDSKKDKGKRPTAWSNFMKKRAQYFATFGILGLLVGGIIAGTTTLVADLPRSLAEQASRVVKARVQGYYRERIKPYLARYLITNVFLNRVGIDNCKNDTGPGPIVTKDCFYRQNQEQYPATFMGKAFQAWRDAKLEAKLAASGVSINYNPDGLLDPSGRRGPLWLIQTPAGEVPIDANNPEGPTVALFESNEFEKPGTRKEMAAILSHIMQATEEQSRTKLVLNMFERKRLYNKYGLKGCNIFCNARDRIDKAKATPGLFKDYVLGLVVLKVIAPMNLNAGLFMGCMFSRAHSCQESDPAFRAAYDGIINDLKAQDGQDRVTKLFDLANAAKNRTEKSLALFFTNLIIKKLANKFAPAIAGSIANGIPIVGQIFFAISTAWTTLNVFLVAYFLYDFFAGPAGQFAITMARAIPFTGLWQMLVEMNDEKFGAKQVYDTNANSAYQQLLKGYEKSFLWQSQYGAPKNFENYSFLFPQTAHAASVDEYPYTCNDDGEKLPQNELVCPSWKFDYTPPVMNELQKLHVSGSTNEFAGELAEVGSDITDTVNAPFEAITEPVLDTGPAQDAIGFINDQLKPVITMASNEVLAPPFDTAEDISGAKFLDGAWAGADWITNDEIRGGVAADGSTEGWARVLDNNEVKVQEAAIVGSLEKEFAALPLWDRIFSTNHNQSFISQLAFAAPSGINTPMQLASSVFNPTMGLRFGMIARSAKAAPANAHPFNIPQYGVGNELYTAPIRDINDESPCANDRVPIDLDTPGAIDKGLGRAEYPSANMCEFDKKTLTTFSTYFSGEPVDPATASGGVTSNFPSGPPGVTTGTFRWPIDPDDFGGVTSCYGNRILNGSPDFHGGLDMVGKLGENKTLIRAADGGKVISVNPYSASAGGFVTIKHSDGLYSFYMHMVPSSIVVTAGQPIGKGQVIGKEGNTGRSFGAHLHFAVGPSPTISDANSKNPLNNTIGGQLTRADVYTQGKECK